MRNFSKADKFQKTILSLLTGLRSDKDDLKRMQKAFEALDVNNDGTLTKEEFSGYANRVNSFKF